MRGLLPACAMTPNLERSSANHAPRHYSTNVPERLAKEADALAERMGGTAALIDYLSSRATPGPHTGAAAEDDDQDHEYAAAKRWHITLRLDGEVLRQLDQHCLATGLTRNRWAASLIMKALCGKAPFSHLERMNANGVVKELKRIEGNTAKSARELAGLEAAVRTLLGRQREIEQFRAEVHGIARSLEETFRGSDAYWNGMVEEGDAVPQDGRDASAPPSEELSGRPDARSDIVIYRPCARQRD